MQKLPLRIIHPISVVFLIGTFHGNFIYLNAENVKITFAHFLETGASEKAHWVIN